MSQSSNFAVRLLFHLQAQLGLADVAYSGDFSRMGLVTTDIELVLQNVCVFIVAAHTLVAVACGYVASSKGRNVGVAATQVCVPIMNMRQLTC